MHFIAKKRIKKWWVLIPAAVVAAFLLEIIQIYTQPLGPDMAPAIHPRRVIMVTVGLFTVFFWMTWCKTWTGIKNAVLSGVRGIRETERKKTVLYLAVFPVGIGAAIFLFWLFCTVISGKTMTAPRFVFAGFVGFFAACLLVFRKTLKVKPEYFFLILTLCIGFLYCYYVPHTGLNSWDEDFHYTQALNASYVDSIVLSQQEENTIGRGVQASYDLNGGIQELNDHMDRRFGNNITERKSMIDLKAVPEFFNGIGLFLGRALGLRYYMIHFLGRFTGLLAYAFAGFFAIRKLKSGKMIAAVCLMIPTEVFIASSYNYDSYLTGFTALGLCYYFSYWQDPEAKVTLKDAVIMIGSIAFGCLTKQIYIPLIWILFLLPGNRFADKKQRFYFRLFVVIATGLVIFSCFLPNILHGSTSYDGDIRGGSDVSIQGQLSYIIQNPLAYAGIVWNYLIHEYFNPARFGELATNLAYHGIMPYQYICLILLFVVAFTDKNDQDRELGSHPWARIVPVALSLLVTVLVISSMYLAFTPVGASHVAGAQFRYLIPMMLPVLFHIGSGLVENKMNRGWYNGLVFCVVAYVGFSCVYNGFICRYY